MPTILLLLVTAFGAGSARAADAPLQVGDPLPALRGTLLTGRAVELPAASAGRVTLAAMGFTYGSRFAVEAWVKRFREDFGADTSVTFFEVPVLGGAARLARPWIDSGMRRGTPPELRAHVITVWNDAGAWKRRMAPADSDVACLALVDRRGRIAWLHRGAFDDAAYATLAEATRRALAR